MPVLIYFALSIALLTMSSLRASRMLLPLYALHVGADTFTVGVLGAIFSAVPLVFSYQAGRLSDRFGARWPLTAGVVATVIGMLLPALWAGLPAIFVAGLLNGVSAVCYIVSLQNLVGQLNTAESRAQGFSNLSLMLAIASFVGPFVTGFLIEDFGFRGACLGVIGITCVPLLMLSVFGARLPGGKGGSDGGKNPGKAGLSKFPGLRAVLLISALVQCGLDMFQYYVPVYGAKLQLSPSSIGVIVAMYSVAAIVVRSAMPVLVARYRPGQVLCHALVLGAVGFALIPFCHDVLLLCMVSLVFGAGMGLGQPITMMLSYSNSPEGRSGESLGLRLTINNVTQVSAPILFGFVGTMLGLPFIFFLNAAFLITGGLISIRIRPSVSI